MLKNPNLSEKHKAKIIELKATEMRPIAIAHYMKLPFESVYEYLRSLREIPKPKLAKYVFTQSSERSKYVVELIGYSKTDQTHIVFPLTRKDLKHLLELGLTDLSSKHAMAVDLLNENKENRESGTQGVN